MWAIVHERDGLRVRVRQLEAENRRLHTIIAGYADQTQLKSSDDNTLLATGGRLRETDDSAPTSASQT